MVDAGSSDNTYRKAKETRNAITLKHRINRGKGAAAKTGIEAAKLLGADIIVTMDSDLQNDPRDIPKLIEQVMDRHQPIPHPDLEQIMQVDRETRDWLEGKAQ